MSFLMEIKLRKEKMELIRNKLGFSSMFVVDSVGRSGGMVLVWGEEISMTIKYFSQRHINGLVENPGVEGSWKFTRFYGHPNVSK
jgi:hypothetical protein